MSLPIETQFAKLLQRAFETGDLEVKNKILEQKNLSALQEFYDAVLRADVDSFANRLASDAEMEIFCPQEFRFIKQAQGRDEIKNAVLHNFSMLEDQKTDLLSVVSQGDDIIVIAREKGVFCNTKENYDVHFMQHLVIYDGLIKYIRQILSFSE